MQANFEGTNHFRKITINPFDNHGKRLNWYYLTATVSKYEWKYNEDTQSLCTNKENKLCFKENLNAFHSYVTSVNTSDVVNTKCSTSNSNTPKIYITYNF
jgi:hypothetical protein